MCCDILFILLYIKGQGWTAGSISRKPKGVRAKIWADLELILNYKGVRVDYAKGQGLFSKTASRRGMGDSRPSDLDLVARIKGVCASNLAR